MVSVVIKYTAYIVVRMHQNELITFSHTQWIFSQHKIFARFSHLQKCPAREHALFYSITRSCTWTCPVLQYNSVLHVNMPCFTVWLGPAREHVLFYSITRSCTWTCPVLQYNSVLHVNMSCFTVLLGPAREHVLFYSITRSCTWTCPVLQYNPVLHVNMSCFTVLLGPAREHVLFYSITRSCTWTCPVSQYNSVPDSRNSRGNYRQIVSSIMIPLSGIEASKRNLPILALMTILLRAFLQMGNLLTTSLQSWFPLWLWNTPRGCELRR
jgi:hypothetical protein